MAGESLELARSLAAHGEVEQALLELGKAIALDPTDPEAHREAGDLYLRRDLPEAAELEYAVALALGEDARVRKALGWLASRRGRDEEAVRQYARAAELDGEDADTFQMLGIVLARMERGEEALAAFLRVLELIPDDGDALHNVGFAYRLAGRSDEAILYLTRALERRPGEVRTLYELGVAQAQKGDRASASATFQELLSIAPDHAAARSRLAELGS